MSSFSESDTSESGSVNSPNHPGDSEIPIKLYRYNIENDTWSSRSDPEPSTIDSPTTNSFAIITWNIDFARDYHFERLETSLDQLQALIEPLMNTDPPLSTVVLLQELHESCFPILLRHPFIRAHYDLTATWFIYYGVVTLTPRSLNVISASRTVFKKSRMEREGLFIDIAFPRLAPEEGNDVQPNPRIVRVANTHLESLRGYGDIARPIHLAVVTSLISKPELYAGIIGGDMNPIGPSDDSVPTELGLLDGWVVCKQQGVANQPGGSVVEDPELVKLQEAEGHTWGYQPRGTFPPRRMDKILFVGNVNVKDIETFGVGLEVSPDKVGGEKVWASDHYGLLAKIEVL